MPKYCERVGIEYGSRFVQQCPKAFLWFPERIDEERKLTEDLERRWNDKKKGSLNFLFNSVWKEVLLERLEPLSYLDPFSTWIPIIMYCTLFIFSYIIAIDVVLFTVILLFIYFHFVQYLWSRIALNMIVFIALVVMYLCRQLEAELSFR
jgi:hypothetical protein